MHTSPRRHSRNRRASHDNDRKRVRIAVAGKNRRSTTGYTPTVDRHFAAKRRPSPEGPRLTALAVFRPIDAGSPWRPPHRHVCKHEKLLVGPFVVDRMPGTTRWHSNGIATALPLCRHASACSYLGPAPRLRRLKHPRDNSRAPGITPAARVLPRLEPVSDRSFTSLDQEASRASLPHTLLTSLYANGFRHQHRFVRQVWRAISGYESRSSPYPSAKVFLSQFGTSPIDLTQKRFLAYRSLAFHHPSFETECRRLSLRRSPASPQTSSLPGLALNGPLLHRSASDGPEPRRGISRRWRHHPLWLIRLVQVPRVCPGRPFSMQRTKRTLPTSPCRADIPRRGHVRANRLYCQWDRTTGLSDKIGFRLSSLPRTGRASLLASSATSTRTWRVMNSASLA